MTTEIAVLNRLGVALATDSAVTISGQEITKVFDSADKLFELSSSEPIGVMINGNMDFLGLPWEVLIKEYRESSGVGGKNTISEWMSSFISFVETSSKISPEYKKQHVINTISSEVRWIQNQVSNELQKIIAEQRLRSDELPGLLTRLLENEVKKKIKFLNSEIPKAESLRAIDKNSLIADCSGVFEEVSTRLFAPVKLSSDLKDLVFELFAIHLLSAMPSDSATGIVIAGFGTSEIFPSIVSIEIDGIIANKIKITSQESVSVGTNSDGGKVVSFAQTDVIDRLLAGADPEFISKTSSFIELSFEKVIESMLKNKLLSKPRKVKKALFDKKLKEIASEIASEYENAVAEGLKKEFSYAFDQMIALMPKKEIIELAEALVSITAVERKATSDEGTVGGPVDVAFISKYDGFVWIKRKHYFDKDLNPRFFWRKFGTKHNSGAAP